VQLRLAAEIRKLLAEIPSGVVSELGEWEAFQLTTVTNAPAWFKRHRGAVDPLAYVFLESCLLGSFELLSRIAPSPEVRAKIAFMRVRFRGNPKQRMPYRLRPVKIQLSEASDHTVH
jgi:hypothetical protein